jgi:hypothetical protein
LVRILNPNFEAMDEDSHEMLMLFKDLYEMDKNGFADMKKNFTIKTESDCYCIDVTPTLYIKNVKISIDHRGFGLGLCLIENLDIARDLYS